MGKGTTKLENQVSTQNYLSVKALTQYLKRKFDVDPYLRKVWVIGEVSNFRMRPNSHQYFSLKDDAARISAVMYRNAFNKLPFRLEEGMKVLAVGRVSLYEPTGSYQLTIDDIQPDGVGALYQALDQLKQKFKAQGLFDLPKKPLPRFPKKIAVITSPTGAVIRDILTTIHRRYPIVGVTVFPTKVQGKEAADEIVSAFEQVASVKDQYDTVIVARGGGSIEDLWPFNEEIVAHAILACELPVISSVGHETDTTMADLVSDLRAPTPTAAAELAVPVLSEVLSTINQAQQRLLIAYQNQLNYIEKRLKRASQSYVLQEPERLYQPYVQQLDYISQRLVQVQSNHLNQLKHSCQLLEQNLLRHSPDKQIQFAKQQYLEQNQAFQYVFRRYLQNKEQKFDKSVELLDAYSPLKVMQRGYSITKHNGKVVKTIKQVEMTDVIEVQFIDGIVRAQVESRQAKLLENVHNDEGK